jgi:DNA invertase Pin-like site-specific DNA recombinase
VSLTEAIDTTTAIGRLMFGVLASLAACERERRGSAKFMTNQAGARSFARVAS